MIHTCKPIAIFSGCASTVFRWWNEKSGHGVPQRWLNFEFPSARSYLSPWLVRFIQLSSYLHGNDGWMGIRKSHTDTITYMTILDRRRNFIQLSDPWINGGIKVLKEWKLSLHALWLVFRKTETATPACALPGAYSQLSWEWSRPVRYVSAGNEEGIQDTHYIVATFLRLYDKEQAVFS